MSSVGDCQTCLLNNNLLSWLLVVSDAWCCCWSVLLCVDLVFFPFCDARYKRYRSDPWEGFIGEESEFIYLISEEKSRDIMLKTGKLLLWACIYIRLFWFTGFTYKGHKWLKWFLPLKLWFWKPFFQNTSVLFWHPIWKYWVEKFFFQTIGREKKNMVYSKLLWKYLDKCGMPWDRCWSGEMVNGDVYEKCTLSPCTYWTANNLCDHIYPNMGTGVVI